MTLPVLWTTNVISILKNDERKAMELKAQLKKRLTQKGITASQLARLSNVPKQSISDWLAGAVPRNLSHLKSVATVLGTTVDELCFGVDTQPHKVSSVDDLIGERWISGVFEVKMRKIR